MVQVAAAAAAARGPGRRRRRRESKLKRAARKLFHSCTCSSFSSSLSISPSPSSISSLQISPGGAAPHIINSPKTGIMSGEKMPPIPSPSPHHQRQQEEEEEESTPSSSAYKSLCAICLDPLSYNSSTGGTSPSHQAIFTAQCSHAFHFACISSNVNHGGVTCPICRAQWTHLPRNLNIQPCASLYGNQTDDPILQILDDSIATFRVHRRSFLRSARYDDDDPIEPNPAAHHPRLHFSLLYEPLSHPSCYSCLHQTIGHNVCHFCGTLAQPFNSSSSSLAAGSINRHYLSVKLAHQPATDLVLVASPNGPHLRLIKQSMALVVFSLRPIDRLAIVTYSSAASRVFPLRRMTSYGKRAALQVIDRLFYMGQSDAIEGLKKGVKVLGDRAHENTHSCILHLSDCPTRSYHGFDMQAPIPIHRFHIGFSFGTSNGFVMHEFEEFLARVLGDAIRDIQLRVGGDARIVRLGELRGGEERRIPLNMSEPGHISVEYSYVEGGADECIRTGEVVVGSGDQRERNDGSITADMITGGRSSNAGSWDYHDSYMARRWAKHLHGYRL